MLSCDLIAQVDAFLSNELSREVALSANRRKVQAEVVSCRKEGEVYCAVLSSGSQLSMFEEVTWVEVKRGSSAQHASLWVTDEKQPYLILSQPISPGTVQLAEADGIQLIEMQKQAVNALKEKSSSTAQILWNCLIGNIDLTGDGQIEVSLDFFNECIGKVESQALAVKKALRSCDTQGFFLIHGPPGTGKTTVITELVRHFVSRGQKVLITSHTNVAVDNVLENLVPFFRPKMSRLGVMAKVSEQLKDLVPAHKDEQFRLSVSKIVGATLSKLSVLVLNKKLAFDEPYFDVVIVDESSMATIPLTLSGVLLGKKFILVGDHKQLPPITKRAMPPACIHKGSCDTKCESLFRLLIEMHPHNSAMLETQFRSHPSIMEFSSKHFYGNRIKSGENCPEKKLVPKELEVEQIEGSADDAPLCYVDMHYDDAPYDNVVEWFPSKSEAGPRHVQPSCLNRYEAAVALKVRHDLIRSGVPADNIWIITPYRLQREIIKKAVHKVYGSLPKEHTDVVDDNFIASTVDSIQGKENDVVIYGLTWVLSEGNENVAKALTDFRRLNVAMTRAKKKLIVIGDLSKLSGQYPYGALDDYLRSNGKVIIAPPIEDEDDFLTIVDGCFSEKQKAINDCLAQKMKEAKMRLRQQLPLTQGLNRFVVRDEDSFDVFKKSGEWEELDQDVKSKCYEYRGRRTVFAAEIKRDSQTRELKIQLIPYKTLDEIKDAKEQEPQRKPAAHEKPISLPILVTQQDFMECGLVNKCLQEDPTLSTREITFKTRLPLNRVASLKAYLEHEKRTNASKPTQKKTQHPAERREQTKACSPENFNNYEVKLGGVYEGVIESAEGDAGVVRIKGFACHVSGVEIGDKIRFRIRAITQNYAEAELEDFLDGKSSSALDLKKRTKPSAKNGKRCLRCFAPLTGRDVELHNGLCMRCSYDKMNEVIAKNNRRSGLYGADRAGTW